MGVPKKDKEILKILGFLLYKLYKSTRKKTDVSKPVPLPLPLLPWISPQNILYANMGFNYVLLSGLAIVVLIDSINSSNLIKYLLDLATKNKDLLNLANQNENLPKLPLNIPFLGKQPDRQQKKRILALHLGYPLCPQDSINKHVIFKQKNKNNLSPVHVDRGEVGEIIKKLDGWTKL